MNWCSTSLERQVEHHILQLKASDRASNLMSCDGEGVAWNMEDIIWLQQVWISQQAWPEDRVRRDAAVVSALPPRSSSFCLSLASSFSSPPMRLSFEAGVRNCASDAFKASVSFSLLTLSRSLPSLHLSPLSKPGVVGEDQREREDQGGARRRRGFTKISQILLTRGYSRSGGLRAKCAESAGISARRLSGRICSHVCHQTFVQRWSDMFQAQGTQRGI